MNRVIVPTRWIASKLGWPTCRLNIRGFGPVEFRPSGSDLKVLRQVFRDREYDLSRFSQERLISQRYEEILQRGGVPVIVDAGANIGAAAIYFASSFPKAAIIAVEPEKENAEICRKNVARFGNVAVVEAALGSMPGFVTICNPTDSSWAFRTERTDNGAIPVRNMSQLLDSVPGGELFAVKMDIEGFESDVFSGDVGWLNELSVLIVEPHDWMLCGKGTSRPLQRAMAQLNFDILIAGENLVYVRS